MKKLYITDRINRYVIYIPNLEVFLNENLSTNESRTVEIKDCFSCYSTAGGGNITDRRVDSDFHPFLGILYPAVAGAVAEAGLCHSVKAGQK